MATAGKAPAGCSPEPHPFIEVPCYGMMSWRILEDINLLIYE
ncbi:MAG: hypothetical protein ACRD4I_00920 [Candidatus Angelobacter sp.]